MEVRAQALGRDLARQPLDVAPHLGADEGVHGRGGETLELPELGRDRRRAGDETAGQLFLQDIARTLLVLRVQVGEQEAHRHRFHPGIPQRAGGSPYLVLVQRDQHLAPRRGQALGHPDPVTAPNQGAVLPGDLLADGVVLGSLVAPDVEDVAVVPGGDHAGAGTVVLEHRVGRDGGAVEEVLDPTGRDGEALAQGSHPVTDAAGRILRRGRHLVDLGAPGLGIREHEVGEGTADVDPYELHRRLLGRVASKSRKG